MKKLISLFLVSLVLIACGKKVETPEPIRPQTEEAFISAFNEAYNSGNKDELYDLIDLNGSNQEFGDFLKMLITSYAGLHTIEELELIPYEADPNMPMEMNGKKIEASIEPIYWFICSTAADGKNETGEIRVAVGRDSSGGLAFCGMRFE